MAARIPPRGAVRLGVGALAGFSLWRHAMRWQRSVDRALRGLGLTHTQLLVLSALDSASRREADAVSQAAIAKEAGLDPVTTGNVLKVLETRGFATREVGLGDKRAWRVRLTREGVRALEAAVPLVEAASAMVRSD
jgi:DNA-binding MarR family transcriptional regulator